MSDSEKSGHQNLYQSFMSSNTDYEKWLVDIWFTIALRGTEFCYVMAGRCRPINMAHLIFQWWKIFRITVKRKICHAHLYCKIVGSLPPQTWEKNQFLNDDARHKDSFPMQRLCVSIPPFCRLKHILPTDCTHYPFFRVTVVHLMIFHGTHCLQNRGKFYCSEWSFIKCLDGNDNIIFSMH